MPKTKISKVITTDELREVLEYNPITGLFYWKESRGGNAVKGSRAGCLSTQSGYWDIKVGGSSYRAHRLAWQYVYGVVPSMLDHIDRNRQNNSITNLREASRSENTLNSSTRSDNTSGEKGISQNKHLSWIANLGYKGTNMYLGSFPTKELAILAREEAIRELGILC
jgi:hypothetical protein